MDDEIELSEEMPEETDLPAEENTEAEEEPVLAGDEAAEE